jgi:hypothetical protein
VKRRDKSQVLNYKGFQSDKVPFTINKMYRNYLVLSFDFLCFFNEYNGIAVAVARYHGHSANCHSFLYIKTKCQAYHVHAPLQ